jgi:predicted transcriptional regulator of viral defense system
MPKLESRTRLSAVLRGGRTLISVDDATQVLGLGRSAAAKVLARWQRQGWVTRVQRGLYAPVPLASTPGDRVVDDPWTLIPELFDPAYVCGASAAHHWDLTEQLFRSVFVCTSRPVRRKTYTVHGTTFVLHHIGRDKLFGTRALWRGRSRLQISDLHRTIIDMLNDPTMGGGIRHVADCLDVYLKLPEASPDTLVDYATRVGNGAIFKRLGFLAERAGAPKALVEACKARLSKGNAKLDPALPCPRLVKRWRLWIPERWKREGAHD